MSRLAAACCAALALALAAPAARATVPRLPAGPAAPAVPGRPVMAHHMPSAMPFAAGEAPAATFQKEVRAALEMGIDGFILDVFDQGQADLFMGAFVAAADAVGAPGFRLMISADVSLGFTAAGMVGAVERWDSSPHYLRINGRPVLTTFNGGALGDAWWRNNVINPLAAAGHPVAFLPTFIGHDGLGHDGDPDPGIAAQYPSADGYVHWPFSRGTPFRAGDPYYGNAGYSELDQAEGMAANVHAAGKLWVTGVMPYYWASCHGRMYYEWQGGRGMENAWASAVGPQAADMVEMLTWDDNSEGTYYTPTPVPIAADRGIPNYSHVGYYELTKYYIRWYKSGVKPTITNDAVFWFHRTQRLATPVTGDCPQPIGDVYGRPDDTVEVTTALTAPGVVRVMTGGVLKDYPVAAGIAHTNVPFNPGQQVITVWRADGAGTLQWLAGSLSAVAAAPASKDLGVASGYDVAGTPGSGGGHGGASERWLPTRTAPYASWFR